MKRLAPTYFIKGLLKVDAIAMPKSFKILSINSERDPLYGQADNRTNTVLRSFSENDILKVKIGNLKPHICVALMCQAY